MINRTHSMKTEKNKHQVVDNLKHSSDMRQWIVLGIAPQCLGLVIGCLFFIGVPLSTQWGPQGYFYPIQIAQYGLSHYSKNLTEKPPHIEVYETAEDRDRNIRSTEWTVPKGCFMASVADKSRSTNVKQFIAPGEFPSICVLHLNWLTTNWYTFKIVMVFKNIIASPLFMLHT